jgi:hypothetical protein
MAAISLFWYTNMAAVTSDENDLLQPWIASKCNQNPAISQPVLPFSKIIFLSFMTTFSSKNF